MFQSPPTSFGGLESMGIILDYRGLYMEYDFSTMIIHDYGLYMIIHGISLFHMDPWPLSEKVQRTLQMIVNDVPVTLPQRVQLDP